MIIESFEGGLVLHRLCFRQPGGSSFEAAQINVVFLIAKLVAEFDQIPNVRVRFEVKKDPLVRAVRMRQFDETAL